MVGFLISSQRCRQWMAGAINDGADTLPKMGPSMARMIEILLEHGEPPWGDWLGPSRTWGGTVRRQVQVQLQDDGSLWRDTFRFIWNMVTGANFFLSNPHCHLKTILKASLAIH